MLTSLPWAVSVGASAAHISHLLTLALVAQALVTRGFAPTRLQPSCARRSFAAVKGSCLAGNGHFIGVNDPFVG